MRSLKNSPGVAASGRIYIIYRFIALCCLLAISQCSSQLKKEEEVDVFLPDAIVGDTFAYKLEVAEVDSNYIWLIENEYSLPPGISLEPYHGVLYGIPERSGEYRIELSVLDTLNGDLWGSSIFHIRVDDIDGIKNARQFYISSSSPINTAYLGEDYSYKIQAKNGIGELVWSSGDMPSGLVLDSATGSIEGIPTSTGLFCIDIFVNDTFDSLRKDNKTLALNIALPEDRDNLDQLSSDSPRLVDEAIARLECGQIVFTPPTQMELQETRKVSLFVSLDNSSTEIIEEILKETGIEQAIEDLRENDVDTREVEESFDELKDEILKDEEPDDEVLLEKTEKVEEATHELKDEQVNTAEVEQAIEEIRNLTISGRLLTEKVRLANRMKATLVGPGFEIQPLTPEVQAVGARNITKWSWNVTPTKRKKQTLTIRLDALIRLNDADSPEEIKSFNRDIEVTVSLPKYLLSVYRRNWQWFWSTLLIPIGIAIWRIIRKKSKKIAIDD